MSTRLALAAAVAVVGIVLGGVAGATPPPDGSAAPDASPAAAPGAEQLVGLWTVVTIGGDDVAGVGASLEFTADGRVQGMGGVNSFHGPYEVVDNTIEFGPAVTTLMAGPEPAMAVEQALFAVLDGAQPFVVDGDVLTLGAGEAAVELQRAPDAGADSAAAEPASEIVTISGTATYRERIALPEGALVIVQVSDVSVADAPSVAVAETTIVPMHEVPIPYAIAVSTSAFEEGHSYSLAIRIMLGDDLLFTTSENLAITAAPAAQSYDVVLTSAGS